MLSDDPDAFAHRGRVRTQQPIPALNRLIVERPVLLADLAPVPMKMPNDERQGRR